MIFNRFTSLKMYAYDHPAFMVERSVGGQLRKSMRVPINDYGAAHLVSGRQVTTQVRNSTYNKIYLAISSTIPQL